MWLFANIVNNENVTVQEEFVDLDLMDRQEHHHHVLSKCFFPEFIPCHDFTLKIKRGKIVLKLPVLEIKKCHVNVHIVKTFFQILVFLN